MEKKNRMRIVLKREERHLIWAQTKDEDYAAFKRAGWIIIVLQVLMLIRNLTNPSQDRILMYYRNLYITMIIVFLLGEWFLKVVHEWKNIRAFYHTAALIMMGIFLWATGITIIDCHKGNDIATFAYAVIATSAIINMEPIVVFFNSGVVTILLCVVLSLSPGANFTTGRVIQIMSVAILANVVSIICYNMRYRRIVLEIENKERILEIEKLSDKLKVEAERDALTGLFNRNYLIKHANQNMRGANDPAGIIMLDIDFFKNVNDTYGHPKGDECLAYLGNIILCSVDLKEGYCVRYGGEEFLIYYKEIDPNQLAQKAEELRVRIEQARIGVKMDIEQPITVSIGYASANEVTTYDDLIALADRNLYEAKQNDRNCVFPRV